MSETFKFQKVKFLSTKLTSAVRAAISGQGRRDFNDLCDALGWKSRDCSLPPIRTDQLNLSSQPFRIQEVGSRSYNVSTEELVFLARLTATLQPKVVFELGTFDGRTTQNLALNSSIDCRLFTIDLPPEMQSLPDDAKIGERFQNQEGGRIVQLLGDTREYDFSPYEGTADMVFVDACHEYEFAANDTAVALHLVKPQTGTIIWHDYIGWPGVTRALNELYSRDAQFQRLRRVTGTSMAILLPTTFDV